MQKTGSALENSSPWSYPCQRKNTPSKQRSRNEIVQAQTLEGVSRKWQAIGFKGVASKKLRDCFREKQGKLSLSCLRLTRLPEGVFVQFSWIQELVLSHSCLSTLDISPH